MKIGSITVAILPIAILCGKLLLCGSIIPAFGLGGDVGEGGGVVDRIEASGALGTVVVHEADGVAAEGKDGCEVAQCH